MSFPRYPTYKDSGVEWLGEVPEHWEVLPLKRRSRLLTEKTECRDNPIALENIEGWTGRLVETDSEFLGEGVAFEPGDILFGKLRPYLAKVYLAANGGQAVGDFHVIHPFDSLHPRFLQFLLLTKEMIDLVNGSTFGAKMPRASWDFLASLHLSIPPLDEQSVIATFLDHETAKIDALIAEQQRLIELLQEKRQAVISHAVTKGLNPDAPMKDSGVEWLGEVPEHWTVIPLRLAARIESGHTPSRSHNEYWIEKDCVHHWFTLGDVWQIRDGKAEYVYETQEKVSQAGLDNSAARMLPANTVILSRTASVGFSGILGVPMATTQDFVNWVCGPKIVPEFLLFVFRAMSKEFERLKYGSTHNTIYMPDIFSFRAPLPSLIEQGEIVSNVRESLRRLDGSFDDLLRSKELLQERRSALISAAVTGQIDVRGLVPEAVAA
jgi:type I restriction enzyme S subunit